MFLQDFNRTIPDIVRCDYRTADVFKKYGINYSSEREISLLEICTSKSLDYHSIVKELTEVTRTLTISSSLHFSEWKLSFLIDYIINVHHAYMHMTIPSLENLVDLFMQSQKNKHPDTDRIVFLFRELAVLLMKHSQHEEEIIFPYIRQIESTLGRREPYGNLFVRTLRKPLRNIEKEHERIISVLQEIQRLINNGFSKTNVDHIALSNKLKEFDADMLQHTYLEDRVLYPRAIQMEQELLQL